MINCSLWIEKKSKKRMDLNKPLVISKWCRMPFERYSNEMKSLWPFRIDSGGGGGAADFLYAVVKIRRL